jgi:hypothetical protein
MAALDLFELFGGRNFRIPDYQRGYAWGEKQLTELWDDIADIAKENGQYRKHYTGTLFLEEISPSESESWLRGSKFFHVIDGQQRLTTVSILVFELLKRARKGYNEKSKDELLRTFVFQTNLSGKSKIYKFSYDETDRNHTYLLRHIFEDESVILDSYAINLYTNNLLAAKNFFSRKIKDWIEPDLDELFEKVTTALHFDVREIEKDLNVQAVFETLNNRGKPLSTLEKLKNRLIFLNDKLPDSREDQANIRKSINSAWGKIYFTLAQNADNVLDEDVFLSAHLSLYRRPKESVFSEQAAEEKVFQMFCNRAETYGKDESGAKEPKVTSEKIQDYIVRLSDSAPHWYFIHNSGLLILSKIYLLSTSKDLKIFLMALHMTCDQETFTGFLVKIERLLFRTRVAWLFDERNFSTWARDLYQNQDTLANIELQIDSLLESPYSVENLIQSLNLLYSYVKGNKGFHRWGPMKYFLFEYETKLKRDANEDNDKVSINDYDETTIEHIIPQDFTENWNDSVSDFCDGISEENREFAVKVLINSLGNLTILKGGKNSSLSNRSWAEKKVRFRFGSYNEINVSAHENWTRKEVHARAIDMIEFLKTKLVGLQLSEDETNRLLYAENDIISHVLR